MRVATVLVAIVGLGVGSGLGGCGDDSGDDVVDAAAVVDAAPPLDAIIEPDGPVASVDAALPNYDFSCMANPWPTTAPDPLLLGGQVKDVVNGGGVADALVEAILASDGSVEASSTTVADFKYALSIPTGGVAADRYKRITKAGHVTSYEFPPFPLFASYPTIDIFTTTLAGRDTLGSLTGVTVDPAKGIVAVLVLDCAGTPMMGANVALPGSGTIVYLDQFGFPDLTLTSTSASGQALLMNVPAGILDSKIDYFPLGMTFRPRLVTSFADSFVFSPRHP